MSDLLQLVVAEGASDLHIRVGTPPTIRVHGILHRVEGPSLGPDDTEELMRSITSEEHVQHVRERGGADFGFAFADAARFRVSVFKERGNFGCVLRQIPNKLLTFEQIAARVGSVREVISRALSRLQNDGLIVLQDRKLTIPDIEALASFAGHALS